MRILICGLPGSGKTTIAECLYDTIDATWYNADRVRQQFNDWDFSDTGRLRQAERMRELSYKYDTDYVICDFVAPTEVLRNHFNADFTIWVDTIDQGRFEDTNKLFEKPTKYNVRVTTQDCEYWSTVIVKLLENHNG